MAERLPKIRRPSPGREARNEQLKLSANFVNALAVTLFVTAFVGPIVNPALAPDLGWAVRGTMALGGLVVHLAARRILAYVEDKQ